jgi:hypothetical protein
VTERHALTAADIRLLRGSRQSRAASRRPRSWQGLIHVTATQLEVLAGLAIAATRSAVCWRADDFDHPRRSDVVELLPVTGAATELDVLERHPVLHGEHLRMTRKLSGADPVAAAHTVCGHVRTRAPEQWQVHNDISERMRAMRRVPGGRVVIAWGPGVHKGGWTSKEFDAFWKRGEHTPIVTFHDFHAGAVADDVDPFASAYFGKVVVQVLTGYLVVLTDAAFEDRQRRRSVEQAFKFAFPDWSVSHVQLGGSAPHGLVIDDDVYGLSGGSSNERIIVESDAPREVLATALESAADRMLRVDDFGREHDAVDELPGPASYVSAVSFDERGRPGFYTDCKGGIEPPVAARFREILVEELRRRDVVTALVRCPVEAPQTERVSGISAWFHGCTLIGMTGRTGADAASQRG